MLDKGINFSHYTAGLREAWVPRMWVPRMKLIHPASLNTNPITKALVLLEGGLISISRLLFHKEKL